MWKISAIRSIRPWACIREQSALTDQSRFTPRSVRGHAASAACMCPVAPSEARADGECTGPRTNGDDGCAYLPHDRRKRPKCVAQGRLPPRLAAGALAFQDVGERCGAGKELLGRHRFAIKVHRVLRQRHRPGRVNKRTEATCGRAPNYDNRASIKQYCMSTPSFGSVQHSRASVSYRPSADRLHPSWRHSSASPAPAPRARPPALHLPIRPCSRPALTDPAQQSPAHR